MNQWIAYINICWKKLLNFKDTKYYNFLHYTIQKFFVGNIMFLIMLTKPSFI